ncbi:MAG: S1 family peptidase [Gemmatimonadaceae bacterium]|jgi:hypothetical protein|nr:S1 family peptidase [Gemmatimonadaceae bacterium]
MREAIQEQKAPGSIEDEYLAIAADEPRFAGLYLDDDLVPVLVSAGSPLSELSKARVLSRVALRSGAFSSVTSHRVRPARYSWLELDMFRKKVRVMIGSSKIPLGVGIDVKKNALVLTTESAFSEHARKALAAADIPDDAFHLRVVDGIVSGSLRSRRRPVTGGLMISSSFSATDAFCSAGLQAWKTDANGAVDPSFGRFIITANHCAPPVGVVTGMQFGQPHRGFGNHMVEVANAEIFQDSRCPYAAVRPCQFADVAVLRMSDSVPSTWQRVALSNTSNPPGFLGMLALSTSTWSAVQGQPVTRVGAQSGQRNGTTMSTCYDVPTANWYVLCSVEVVGYADGGDSGGPVYTPLISGWPGTPWPSGIFHTYTLQTNSPYWFSSVEWVLFALNGEYVIN